MKLHIRSSHLDEILNLRQSAKMLKERLALVEDAIAQAEANVIAAIDAGVNLSRLGYRVAIQESFRRYPSWKEHFVRCLGKDAADQVVEATPATLYRKLVINP